MDIQKEKKAIKNLKAFYMEDWNLTEEERDDLDNLVSRIVAVVKTEAQAVPDGFVLVPKEPTDKTIAHMINTPIEVNLLCDHADVFLSEGEAYIAYQAMIEAQEPTND